MISLDIIKNIRGYFARTSGNFFEHLRNEDNKFIIKNKFEPVREEPTEIITPSIIELRFDGIYLPQKTCLQAGRF